MRAVLRRVRSRVFGPPMLRDRLMEVRYGSWAGVLEYRDTSGRPLGEGASRSARIEWSPYRGHGYRQGKPFNASALQHVLGEFDTVLRDLACVRGILVRRGVITNPNHATPLEAFVLARTMTSIPAYLARRRQAPLKDGRLPSRFGGAFKVLAGVHSLAEQMITGDGDPYRDFSVDELWAYIESERLFLSKPGRVCPGPERMVRKVLHDCVHGGESASEVASPLPDVGRAVSYGVACASIDLVVLRLLSGSDDDIRVQAAPMRRWFQVASRALGRTASSHGLVEALFERVETNRID